MSIPARKRKIERVERGLPIRKGQQERYYTCECFGRAEAVHILTQGFIHLDMEIVP